MVFSSIILGFIVSKEGKLLDPKRVEVIVKILVLKNPHDFQDFNNLAQFY
jgi:hypothetical protein